MELKHIEIANMRGKGKVDIARYKDAFANLPRIQRKVFRLHRLEGLSYREIAWLMRVSDRYVERQMAKAISKLAKQMDGHPLSWWEHWF
jgi:RNA polymerase sigma factor (sigma-70 family)